MHHSWHNFHQLQNHQPCRHLWRNLARASLQSPNLLLKPRSHGSPSPLHTLITNSPKLHRQWILYGTLQLKWCNSSKILPCQQKWSRTHFLPSYSIHCTCTLYCIQWFNVQSLCSWSIRDLGIEHLLSHLLRKVLKVTKVFTIRQVLEDSDCEMTWMRTMQR